jgi:SPP1 gp7 family putative phage head morphogenesis protein
MPVDLLDNQLRLSLLIERYRPTVLTETSKALNEALYNIQLKLLKTEDIPSRSRLLQLERLIVEELNAAYAPMNEQIISDMSEVAETSFTNSMKALGTHGAEVVAFAALPKKAINAMIDMNELVLLGDKGYKISDFVSLQTDTNVKRFKQIVAAGIGEGAPSDTIARRLREVNKTANRNDLEAIARTVVAEAMSRGNREAYKQADDVINAWEYSATLDNRTTKRCASLDGRIWRKSEGWTEEKLLSKNYVPPTHFRCRSQLIPRTALSAQLDKDRTRASNMDSKGQISAKTNFQEAFDRQSAEFQKDYLGPARYKLYKENRMEIKDFVDIKSGREYTIEEIKERLA